MPPSAIDEGLALVRRALDHRPAGRYALVAAIAAVQAEAPRWEDTDWRQLVDRHDLHDLLLHRWPSPVVALNRVGAVSFADGPEQALTALNAVSDEPSLAAYPYLAATRADLLRRLDRRREAIEAHQEALLLTENRVEADFLTRRINEVRSHGWSG